MSDMFKTNIVLLRERFPALYDNIAQSLGGSVVPPMTPPYTVSTAKSGALTALENGTRLHSAYDPVKEAHSIVKRIVERALKDVSTSDICHKTLLVTGVALGYIPIEAASSYPESRLVIIEPSIQHFLYSLTVMDWSIVFKLKNISLLLAAPSEACIAVLEQGSQGDYNIGTKSPLKDIIYLSPECHKAHALPYFKEIEVLIKRN